MPLSAGVGRRCSADWPRRASASARRESMSAKGLCTASTSAPRASWWWRSPSARTRCSSVRSSSAPSTSAITLWCRATPIRPAEPSTRRSGAIAGHDWKFAVTEGGRHSITHYDTLEAHQAASLLDVELETGRTHQIRVHFAALHHPCAGDLTYGADPTLAKRLGLERQWLHARSLAFAHPADGRRVEITSPYPADLQHALDVLRHQER